MLDAKMIIKSVLLAVLVSVSSNGIINAYCWEDCGDDGIRRLRVDDFTYCFCRSQNCYMNESCDMFFKLKDGRGLFTVVKKADNSVQCWAFFIGDQSSHDLALGNEDILRYVDLEMLARDVADQDAPFIEFIDRMRAAKNSYS